MKDDDLLKAWGEVMDFFNKFPGLKGTRVRADIWDAMTPQQRHKFILTSDGPDGLVVAVDDGAAK